MSLYSDANINCDNVQQICTCINLKLDILKRRRIKYKRSVNLIGTRWRNKIRSFEIFIYRQIGFAMIIHIICRINTHQFSSTPTFEKFGGKLAAAIDGRR